VTPTVAALVPLVLQESMFHAELSGIAVVVELSTVVNGKVVDRRTGSLLWTHFGVSGPIVMDVSRYWTLARAHGQVSTVRCNFFPGQEFGQVEKWLLNTAKARPRISVGKGVSERIEPSLPLSQLAREQRRALVHALSDFALAIERDRGWNFAEVTAGGVPLQEIDYRTMESRKVRGLYLVGEILDCDGRIGGFNFQWAWATGYLAGGAVGRSAGTPTPRNVKENSLLL
jgi:predicted Rossmann fold flavoprotein